MGTRATPMLGREAWREGILVNREDVIRMAREAGGADITSHGWTSWVGVDSTEFLERFAALVTAAEREKVAAWMRSKSYATGHGDTIEDLLKELEWQVAEREREACAKVAESYEPRCDVCPKGVANAIRARGEA